MTAINPIQIQALRSLVAIWPKEQMVLIGASAISCFLEMKRMTFDIDLSISIENYGEILKNLDQWSPDPTQEGRWLAPGNVKVDIIPAGPDLLANGHFVWPHSKNVMSLVGFRLAFGHSVELDIEKDFLIRVAPLTVLVVLKIAAYIDRPTDRERDLGDIALIIDNFVSEDRRFSDDIIDLELEYPDVSPYMLGVEIAHLVNKEELAVIQQFLNMTRDENNPHATLARMARGSPSELQNPSNLIRALEAFERGLYS